MGNLREAIQVEWVSVTYRSVATLVLVLVLLVFGGGGSWFYVTHVKPKQDADAALGQADARVAEASELMVDGRMAETLDTARLSLDQARVEFDGGDYQDAAVAAMRAETLAAKVIASVKGNEGELRPVHFNRIEGEVRVKKAGEFSWRSADRRMELGVGDQIKTSSSASAELIYFDKTVSQIQPGSLLEIRDLYEDPVTKVRRVREKLTFGEVRASTKKRNVSGSYHEVATEKVAARSEEAGEFRVAFSKEKKTTTLDVFEGKIALQTAAKKDTLEAGERITARSDGRLSAKQSLPDVPRLLGPSDQRVFVFENPLEESLALTWEGVAGAEVYRLMISERSLFTDPLYDAERAGTRALLEAVPSGSYHWRVSAIKAGGVQGPFSEARRFRVSSRQIRDDRDTEPPDLQITEFVPIGQMVIINGQTEPGATLWIDDSKVELYDDGSFNAVVKLRREGHNELVLVAQDNAGNEATVRRSAYVEVY